MRIITYILSTSIITLIFSCSSKKESTSRVILSDSEEGRKLKRQRDSIYYLSEKKRFPSSTFDLLAINSDTLIASTKFNGIVFSSNAGHTWTSLSDPGTICKLTIDDKKQLWGLYSWRGIHEEDRSILFLSIDLGKTWQKFELKTTEIFPADFYSKSREQLRVIDFESRIFKMINSGTDLKWLLVDSLRVKQDLSPWIRKKFVIDSKKRRWTFNSDGIFLIDKDTTKVY